MVHLHLHTEYSLLDGAARISDLVKAAKTKGFSAMAITDHGAMYGVVDFYRACKAEGIHPVIGFEAYVAPGSLHEKAGTAREYAHLVLLAETQKGYENLTKLCSIGFVDGFYYKPRIDLQVLQQHAEGLIGLSACLAGEIPQLLMQNQFEQAKVAASRLAGIFAPGNFYIELQDHGLPEQKQILPQLARLAQELNLPMVATNDVHYVEADDAEAQDVLLCIQTGRTVDDENRMRMNSREFYLKSPEEMATRFAAWPESVTNSDEIAARCRVEFTFGHLHLPHFDIPEDHADAAAYLTALAREGTLRRYGEFTSEIEERLAFELDTIIRMGFADYYLIVWDFCRYALDNGIFVGPGRGSGAGSLVAYALHITNVDPLKYQLLFERFLSPERVSMPDFDIDFCYVRRGEVIQYVIEKYGAERVAQIITFGTMAARAAIRDVGRALNMPYAAVDKIAKMVPFELGITLRGALEKNPLIQQAADADPTVQKLLTLAQKLEGLPRHASTHAAGVVICSQPVMELVPLQRNEDAITTQFPMGTIEKLGLLKMDFLGLRTLTVLRDCLQMARDAGQEVPDLDTLPFDDPAVYQMIGQGDTDGVFQLESGGMRSFMRELKPASLEDIIAGISLYRPGPMASIPKYVAGKRNPASVRYIHPILEKSLDVTYGCMVYQEQVMQIVRDMAGYSLARSDLVRRAMAKKHRDEMMRERQVFIHGLEEGGKVVVPGCLRLGISEEAATDVFEEMTSFAEYAFNKSHATGYAVIAYQTAYLKVHFPIAFYAALLNSVTGNNDKIAQYFGICRKNNIPVLPPCVNRSVSGFSVEGESIRFGLDAVRNVGSNVVRSIMEVRQTGAFTSLFDFCDRLDGAVNRRMLEGLILSGAFDFTEVSRARLVAAMESAIKLAVDRKKRREDGQMSLFGDTPPEITAAYPDVPPYNEQVQLALEKDATGVYLSGHPLQGFGKSLARLPNTTAELLAEDDTQAPADGSSVTIGGIVVTVKQKSTRNNSMMAIVTLEDLYGQLELLVFAKLWERESAAFEVGAAVAIQGRLSRREDEPPVITVNRVSPLVSDAALEDQPALCKKLFLRLNEQEDPGMEQALPLLKKHRGFVPVYVYKEAHKQTYLSELTCDGSEQLAAALGEIFGEDSVRRVM